MPKTSGTISNHFEGFISNQIEAGRYETASEVGRAGLRMLEDYKTGYRRLLEALRTPLDVGVDQLDSGEGVRVRFAASPHLGRVRPGVRSHVY